MITLSPDEFEALWKRGTVISKHKKYGPKVFSTENGDYVKVFNPKSGLTKRRLFPKYKKFIANANRLKKLGIPTITVNNIYFLTKHQNYAVRYEPLIGYNLRDLFVKEGASMISDFLPFLAKLHALGIYFRGIHLGNVLKLSSHDFGLIDMTDLYIKHKPLSVWHRVRNVSHMVNMQQDDKIFKTYGIVSLLNDYVNVAKLTNWEKIFFYMFAQLYHLR